MENNWVMQRARPGRFLVFSFNDNRPSIGSDIESESTEQFGTVIGVISNKRGEPVCYKVWCWVDDEPGGCFDYIPCDKVSFWEPCSSVRWSLERIGYQWMDEHSDGSGGYFYNNETEDVVFW